MKSWLFVFLGGGLGSMFRFFLTQVPFLKITNFPLSTLSANLFSSLVLGFFYMWFTISPDRHELRWLLMVGFCGGLSTFSTFTAENANYIHKGNWAELVLYITGSVVLCLLCFWLGEKMAISYHKVGL